jgi:predicted RNA-binding protein with PIN domain
MEALLGIMANRITVVFDGTVGGKQTGFESSAVEVQFTAADASADSVIERLSAETDTPTSIAVVSSDRLERYSVESSGVRVLSCRAFLDEVALAQVELQSHIKNFKRKNHTRGTLGDFFP